MCLRVAIKVAYFNTNNLAHGFQIQPNVETIFSILKKAIIKSNFLEMTEAQIDYAGRTDFGVNAICQVIAFNLAQKYEKIPIRFLYRINTYLPKNIRCWAYSVVPNEFNPRFNALERQYQYIYSLRPNDNLEIELMNETKNLLIGSHNFINFAKKDSKDVNYNRKITEITIQSNENQLVFTIKAQSFLWQQCRRITAHLIQIGKRQVDSTYTKKLLNNTGKIVKPTPLPPENLILTNIIYNDIIFEEDKAIKLKISQLIEEELYEIRKKRALLNSLLKTLE